MDSHTGFSKTNICVAHSHTSFCSLFSRRLDYRQMEKEKKTMTIADEFLCRRVRANRLQMNKKKSFRNINAWKPGIWAWAEPDDGPVPECMSLFFGTMQFCQLSTFGHLNGAPKMAHPNDIEMTLFSVWLLSLSPFVRQMVVSALFPKKRALMIDTFFVYVPTCSNKPQKPNPLALSLDWLIDIEPKMALAFDGWIIYPITKTERQSCQFALNNVCAIVAECINGVINTSVRALVLDLATHSWMDGMKGRNWLSS